MTAIFSRVRRRLSRNLKTHELAEITAAVIPEDDAKQDHIVSDNCSLSPRGPNSIENIANNFKRIASLVYASKSKSTESSPMVTSRSDEEPARTARSEPIYISEFVESHNESVSPVVSGSSISSSSATNTDSYSSPMHFRRRSLGRDLLCQHGYKWGSSPNLSTLDFSSINSDEA